MPINCSIALQFSQYMASHICHSEQYGGFTIMNYGGNGIRRKKKLLNSSATKFKTKFGIFIVKLLLVCAIAVVIGGSCLVFGAAQGIIQSAPDIYPSMCHQKALPQRYTIMKETKYRLLPKQELTVYMFPLTRYLLSFSTHSLP